MTTPPYGQTDPLATPPPPGPSSSPIGDELARHADLGSSSGPDTGAGAADAAKEKAQDVKETAQDALGSATEHGAHVAGTAKDEALSVAAEAKDKATDLLGDLKTQVDEQSKTQLSNLAAKVKELADELESLVQGSDSSGTVSSAAQQLADKTHQLGSHLESRQPTDLLEDVRDFARRRPTSFLVGAAVAGVVAGRLTRGAKAAQFSDGGSGVSSSTTTAAPQASATPSFAPQASAAPSFSPPPSSTLGSVGSVPPGQNTGGPQ